MMELGAQVDLDPKTKGMFLPTAWWLSKLGSHLASSSELKVNKTFKKASVGQMEKLKSLHEEES